MSLHEIFDTVQMLKCVCVCGGGASLDLSKGEKNSHGISCVKLQFVGEN